MVLIAYDRSFVLVSDFRFVWGILQSLEQLGFLLLRALDLEICFCWMLLSWWIIL